MKKLTPLFVPALALAFLAGCLSPQGQADLERRLERVTTLGVDAILIEHPQWTNEFRLAATDLRIIEATTNNVGIEQVIAIVRRLPVKELRTPQARLYINAGIFILEEAGVPLEVNPESSARIKGVAGALRRGIETALSYQSASLRRPERRYAFKPLKPLSLSP